MYTIILYLLLCMNLNINYGNIMDGHVKQYWNVFINKKNIYMKLVVEGSKRDECIGKY